VGVVSIEDITVYYDSEVCSADVHHNLRKHVGLHPPQTADQRAYQPTAHSVLPVALYTFPLSLLYH
jgi:hypothetical protein